jgi:hypothetical protein
MRSFKVLKDNEIWLFFARWTYKKSPPFHWKASHWLKALELFPI